MAGLTFESTPLGIVAGGTGLPMEVADAVLEGGREVHLLGIVGEASPDIARYSHDWIKWGEVGRLFSILREKRCQEVVIIGRVTRPGLSQIRMDYGGWKLLAEFLTLRHGGDDRLLSGIAGIFEREGFMVRSVLDVAPALAAPGGLLTRKQPNSVAMDDISIGRAVIEALGPYDVGQAVVVVCGHVTAVEGIEGTDRMLERCADLRPWKRKGRHGVLVKMPKPGQDRRMDLPTIGPATVDLVARAGLAGIAVMAGNTLLAEREALLARARAQGLFLLGVELEDLAA